LIQIFTTKIISKKITDISKKISIAWKKLDPEERVKWNLIAKKDKVRIINSFSLSKYILNKCTISHFAFFSFFSLLSNGLGTVLRGKEKLQGTLAITSETWESTGELFSN
jgi:hypothetical protein